MSSARLALFAIAFAVCSVVRADTPTIDFATLGGNNLDAFSSYVEHGYTVSSTAGAWKVGKLFGNPIPDVFCGGCGPGTLEVTGGTFNFDSVDIGNPVAPSFGITITGFLAGIQVLTETATSPPPGTFGTFETITSNNTSQKLDELFISINTATSDGNVDNIVLSSAVPEPSSVVLLSTVLLGVAFFARKRFARSSVFPVE